MSDYYADERLSASKLKNYITHDPAIAYWMETNQSSTSDALRYGTALHTLMEGQPLEISPHDSYRTKEAKEYKANHPNALKLEEAQMVTNWRTAIENHLGGHHPYLWDCWQKGQYEVEYFTKTHKAKVDCIHDGVLLDWKTTRHTRAEEVIREYQRYGAAIQASLYLDLSRAKEFHFVVVSKVEPHPVWVLTCSERLLSYGRDLRKQAEEAREQFLSSGTYGAWMLEPPPWVASEEDVTI